MINSWEGKIAWKGQNLGFFIKRPISSPQSLGLSAVDTLEDTSHFYTYYKLTEIESERDAMQMHSI